MKEERVSYRYARALLDLAKQENVVEQIFTDMKIIKNVFDSSDELKAVSTSPLVHNWKKRNIYNELFKDKVSKLSMDFVILLTMKNRDNLLDTVVEQFEKIYNDLNNNIPVKITSAVELDDAIKEKTLVRLSSKVKKNILPTFKIDDSLKGGLMIQVEDWVYDASIKNQLKNLYKELS